VVFEEVYERFRKPIWRLARRMTSSEDLAAALTGIELAGLADSDYAAELVVGVDVPR
jgi:DNA-directed RNA polymerase specialized sigma24 family protein